jgi:hypothetical protein
MTTKILRIERIQFEGNHQILWGKDRVYRVITQKDVKLKKGDTVYYEPDGENSGSYLGVLE